MTQCEATAKSTGERCKKDAIPGTNVCHVHGGNAPQVRKKAQERLDAMADDVTADMQGIIDDLTDLYERADTEGKVAIAREIRQNWVKILDRTGHGPTETKEFMGEGGGPIEINLNEEIVETPYGDE